MHIGHRVADGLGAVIGDVEGHGSGYQCAEFVEPVADGIHHRHRVGIWLTLHGQNDGAIFIEPACGVFVLRTVAHNGHIAQAYGLAIAEGNGQRAIAFHIQKLAWRINGDVALGS